MITRHMPAMPPVEYSEWKWVCDAYDAARAQRDELLAALRSAVDHVCECEGPNESNNFMGRRCYAHAAIAKAEGRS